MQRGLLELGCLLMEDIHVCKWEGVYRTVQVSLLTLNASYEHRMCSLATFMIQYTVTGRHLALIARAHINILKTQE
jgi:hypothetical protein